MSHPRAICNLSTATIAIIIVPALRASHPVPVSRNALTSLNLKQSGVAPAAHEPDLPRTVELDSSAFRFVPKPLPLGRALLKLPSELGHLSDLLGATAYASGSFWQRRSHGQHGPTCDTAVSLIWSVKLALSDSQAFVACSKAGQGGRSVHYMLSQGGHMNDSPVGVSSAIRDRRGRAWQGMAGHGRAAARQGIKHPKTFSTHACHVDQKNIYIETIPRFQLLACGRSRRFSSLTLQFISYHDLHIHSIFSNVPIERSSISNSTCQVVPDSSSLHWVTVASSLGLACRSRRQIWCYLSRTRIPDLHRTCSHSRAPRARPHAG